MTCRSEMKWEGPFAVPCCNQSVGGFGLRKWVFRPRSGMEGEKRYSTSTSTSTGTTSTTNGWMQLALPNERWAKQTQKKRTDLHPCQWCRKIQPASFSDMQRPYFFRNVFCRWRLILQKGLNVQDKDNDAPAYVMPCVVVLLPKVPSFGAPNPRRASFFLLLSLKNSLLLRNLCIQRSLPHKMCWLFVLVQYY